MIPIEEENQSSNVSGEMSLKAPKSLYPNPNANSNPTTDVTRKVPEHGAARREKGITSTNSDAPSLSPGCS